MDLVFIDVVVVLIGVGIIIVIVGYWCFLNFRDGVEFLFCEMGFFL